MGIRRRLRLLGYLALLAFALLLFTVAGSAYAQLSLKDVEVPEPTNLHAFLKGDAQGTAAERAEAAEAERLATVLGKALFWDMQVGTDDVQACASCHFNAGADPRPTNQINPGALPPTAIPDTIFGNSMIPGVPGPNDEPWLFRFGPNMAAVPGFFPFHLRQRPTAPAIDPATGQEAYNVVRDTNDVMSSQGVRESDMPWPFNDGVFNWMEANQRRVEPRNAPTMINAVYHLDMFWDGRASFVFNGVNPFGFRDRDATVRRNVGTPEAPNVVDVKVRIPFAGHASQAVGPPLSHFEMAGTFRSFQELADKMIDPQVEVLGLQVVHPEDSVLGVYARSELIADEPGQITNVAGTIDPATGESLTYRRLVELAFRDEWWSAGTAQMRDNFSLFFGLALQVYQATLISDDTPFDRFMGSEINFPGGGTVAAPRPIAPDPTALTAQEQLGLDIFQGTNVSGQNPTLFTANCNACHLLPETTNHTTRLAFPVAPVVTGGPTDLENVVVPNGVIEAMPMGGFVPPAAIPPVILPGDPFLNGFGLYDVGFYNIGVRPTGEDLGRGVNAPATTGFPDGLPLAYAQLSRMKEAGQLPLDVAEHVPDIPAIAPAVEVPLADGTVVLVDIPTEGLPVMTQGNFKVPNLRNQEFQGPYFRTGSAATLRHVVEFYARGGDFPLTNAAELDADIAAFPELDTLTPGDEADRRLRALVAFISRGLTDPRVRNEQAPFDHPQLIVPEGVNALTPGDDRVKEIKATGAQGGAAIPRFLGLNPQLSADADALGRIAGRVTADGTALSLQGIQVSAYRSVTDAEGTYWQQYSIDYTDGGGFYRLNALGPGSYKVRFYDETTTYIGESYDNAPYTLSGASLDVTVAAGQTITGVDAALTARTGDAFEPDNDRLAASLIKGDTIRSHTLSPGDEDWIRIDARTGNTYVVSTSGDLPVDTFLELWSADGVKLSQNNDGGGAPFSRISHTASADEPLFFRVSGYTPLVAGPYTLSITATDVTKPVTTADAQESYGGSATIELTAEDDWSGVARIEYALDGGPWTEGATVETDVLGPHTLTFRATDTAGNVEDAQTATFAVIYETQLSVDISLTKTAWAEPTVISGVLTWGPGPEVLAGEPVLVQTSRYGLTNWKTLAALTTDDAGAVSFSHVPIVTAYYRLVYEGKAEWYAGQTSLVVKCKPQVYLTTPRAPAEVVKGKKFKATGLLKPKHAAGTKPVKIRCYRRIGGVWVLKRTVDAVASDYNSTTTRYTARFALPSRGLWLLRAWHPVDERNAGTLSKGTRVRVL